MKEGIKSAKKKRISFVNTYNYNTITRMYDQKRLNGRY